MSTKHLAEQSVSRRPWLIVLAFVSLFVAALFLDIPVSTWAHEVGLAPYLKNHQPIALAFRVPGNLLKFTLPLCVLLIAVQYLEKRPFNSTFWTTPALILLAAAISGINTLLKLCIGRIRPYHGVPPFELHPFSRRIIDAEAGFSFPSGDASLAIAMAASLSMVYPKLWPLWWALATIVGLERIAENAHYPSDVVAGAALGVASAYIARWLITKGENRPGNTIIES